MFNFITLINFCNVAMVMGAIINNSSNTIFTANDLITDTNIISRMDRTFHNNNSVMLNLQEAMTMRPEQLPTIDESSYADLVTTFRTSGEFVMDIPQTLEDAYSAGNQYVQRLENRGRLPPDFQARKVKRNEHAFDPNLFRLTAYDCSKPTEIKNLMNGPDNDCLPNDVETAEAEQTFTVIQETKTRRHSGFRCVMLETRRTYQCGGFDHSINVDHLTYENRAIRVSQEICERMAYQREFKTYTGIVTPIKLGYTDIPFHLFGYTSVTQGGHVDCVGTAARIQGEYFHDIVVWVNIRLLLETVQFAYTGGQMQTNVGQVLPPHCTVERRACTLDMASYIWAIKEDETCTVERTTTFRGRIFNRNGNRELMAVDNSMIALTVKGKTMRCGKEVHYTDIKGLFVEEGRGLSWKPIHVGSLSTTKYSNAKDAWIFKFTMQEMQNKFKAFSHNVCSRESSIANILYEANTRRLGVTTWAYDDVGSPGMFATTAGESIYTYQCTETLVVPRVTPNCYREMPVWVQTATNRSAMFLEPYSRLLKPIGLVTPCSTLIKPKFETTSGAWITTPPNMQVTTAPAFLPQEADTLDLNWEYPDLDFEQSGIYNYSQREQLHRYLQFGQNQRAKSYELAFQTEKFRPGQPISPDMMFPPGKVDITSWQNHVLGALTPLYKLVDVVGDIFSIGIVVTLVLAWGKQMLNVTMAAKALHYLFGCSWQLLWACLPKFSLQTQNVYEHSKVKQRAGKRSARKATRQAMRAARAERIREKRERRRKLKEEEQTRKQRAREAKKANKNSANVAVEDVVRALLENSVRQSIETDTTPAPAAPVPPLPNTANCQQVTQAIVHTHNDYNNVNDNDTLVKQRPPRPPPPRRVSSLCRERVISETEHSLYEDFEAGKAASLPRSAPINIHKTNRCKSVSFAPSANVNLRTFRKSAVIRRQPSPYDDAQRILQENAIETDSERYPVLPGDSSV